MFLRRHNHRRTVDPLVDPVTGADIPAIAQLIVQVDFVGSRLQTQRLFGVVEFRADVEELRDRHAERPAVIGRIFQGQHAGRRVTGVDFLYVRRHQAVAKVQQLIRRQAEVGAARPGIRVEEGHGVVSVELEATVARVSRRGDQSLAARLLDLQPGLGIEAEREVRAVQAVVAVILSVAVGRDAQLDVVAEPQAGLTAGR